MDRKVFVEAIKEVGRYVLFGLVAYLIAYLSNAPQTETTVVLLGVLRGVDKYLHQRAKVKEGVKLKGLSPF